MEAGDPRLTTAERGGRAPDPRQARPFLGATVAEQNWGESALQMQGGATLEHRFSGAQVLRATVWAARRRVDTALVIRALDLRRRGAGLRSEYQGAVEVGSTTLEWTAGVDVSSKEETRLDYRFLPPFRCRRHRPPRPPEPRPAGAGGVGGAVRPVERLAPPAGDADGRGPLRPLPLRGGGPKARRRRSVGPPHHERPQPPPSA